MSFTPKLQRKNTVAESPLQSSAPNFGGMGQQGPNQNPINPISGSNNSSGFGINGGGTGGGGGIGLGGGITNGINGGSNSLAGSMSVNSGGSNRSSISGNFGMGPMGGNSGDSANSGKGGIGMGGNSFGNGFNNSLGNSGNFAGGSGIGSSSGQTGGGTGGTGLGSMMFNLPKTTTNQPNNLPFVSNPNPQNPSQASRPNPTASSQDKVKQLLQKLTTNAQLSPQYVKFLQQSYSQLVFDTLNEKKADMNNQNQLNQKVDINSRMHQNLKPFFTKTDQLQEVEEYYLGLWVELAKCFQREFYFIQVDVVLQQIKEHIIANARLYLNESFAFSNQSFLTKIYSLTHSTNSGSLRSTPTVRVDSELFKKIYQQIQSQIFLKFQLITLILTKINKIAYQSLTKNEPTKIIENMTRNLKTVLTHKQIFVSHEENPIKNQVLKKSKLAEEIIDSLSTLNAKEKKFMQKTRSIFTQEKIVEIFLLVDQKISKNNDKIKKKLINLLNQILFADSDSCDAWTTLLKTTVQKSKSHILAPFRTLTLLSKQKSVRSIQPYEIIGRQWLGVCNNFILIQYQNKQFSINSEFENMLFHLICSIISEDPVSFWKNPEENEKLYGYIGSLGEEVERDDDPDKNSIGKIIRLMICMLPHVTRRTEEDDPTVQQVFNSFLTIVFPFNQINMDLQSFFVKYVFPSIKLADDDQNIRPCNETEIKYHKFLSSCCKQLILEFGIGCPMLIKRIFKFYQNYAKLKPYQISLLIYQVTFDYLQEISTQHQLASRSQVSDQPFLSLRNHSLPKIFKFLDSLLGYDDELKSACSEIFESIIKRVSKNLIQPNYLAYIFTNLITTEQTISSFADHIISLYKNDLYWHQWNTQICLPLLFEMLDNWQISAFKFYAKIFTGILQKGIDAETPQVLQFSFQGNVTFDEFQEIFRKGNNREFKKNQFHSLLSMIQTFFKHTDYLLKFINWSLRIEEMTNSSQAYYNILFQNQQYDVLISALNLLLNLMKFYEKYSDEYFIPSEIKKYFSIFQFQKNAFEGNNQNWQPAYNYSNIMLTNNKIVTLPGALLHLAVSGLSNSNQGTEQAYLSKNVIRITFNILSCMILQNKEKDIEIDYKVYQSHMQDRFAILQNPVDQVLEPYLLNCLKAERSPKKNQRKSETLSGEMLDLLSSLTKFREIEKVKVFAEIVNARTKVSFQLINMKEIESLSRALLPLTDCLRQDEKSLMTQLEVTIDNILYIVTHEISAQIHNKTAKNYRASQRPLNYFSNLLINVFRCLRYLQLKDKTRFLLAHLIKKYVHFIFHPSLLKECVLKMQSVIGADDSSQLFLIEKMAIEEYFSCLEIVLCCPSYLKQEDLLIVCQADDFPKILKTFIEELVNHPKFYMLLNYAIKLTISQKQNNFLNSQSTQYRNRPIKKRFNLEGDEIEEVETANNFSKLSVFTLMMLIQNENLNLEVLPFNAEDIIRRWDQYGSYEHLMESGNYTSSRQIIPEAVLFNIVKNNSDQMKSNSDQMKSYDIFRKAITINHLSSHYLTFVSSMNYLYRRVTQQNLHDQEIGTIMNEIEQILTTSPQSLEKRTNLYQKSWACTILNAVIANYNDEQVYKKMIELVFDSTVLMDRLGILLEGYGRCTVQWPYFIRASNKYPGISLLEKQYLLSLLKVISTFLSKHQMWKKLIGLDEYNPKNQYRKSYSKLCQSFISATKILKPNYPGLHKPSMLSQNRYNRNASFNSYEESLQSIPIEAVIQQAAQEMNIFKQISQIDYSAYMKDSTVKTKERSLPAYLNQELFPNTPDSLDLIHEHLDLLITQRFLMILSSCYDNKDIGLFEYDEVLWIVENEVRKLKGIYKQKMAYQIIVELANEKIWESCNMSEELYYLNLIQQPYEDSIQLHNSTLEVGLSLCKKLKREMETHVHHRQFMREATKLMHLISSLSRQEGMFNFDTPNYILQFLDRSQFGQSFITASRFI